MYQNVINTAEKFQDFCVAGKELFLVQNNSHKVDTLLNWEKYGLRITIPQEALPLYDTVEVAIAALVGGEFILPEDTELVSAVYVISVSKPLLKPVQLEIQHCVFIEKPVHSNYLSFATAPSDQASCEFQPVKGAGEFFIGSRYGSIYITEFSWWSIIKKQLRNMRSRITSIHPPISQPSLSPSTEAVHSPTQHQPSPPITISTTPLPVIPEASPCSSESSPSITVSSTTTLDNTAPTDSSLLEGMYHYIAVTC